VRRNDGRLHVAGRPVDVAIGAEGQLDVRGADPAAGGHVVDVAMPQVPFQRSRDGTCHDLRAGARQLRGDENRRHVDARQRATGSSMNATAPHRATPAVSRMVATGRRMKGAKCSCRAVRQRFARIRARARAWAQACGCAGRGRPAQPRRDTVEGQVNHGVVNKVNTWLTSRPPTMLTPSGWRSSEPCRAEHQRSAPNIAATVVIRMGRNRSRQAL